MNFIEKFKIKNGLSKLSYEELISLQSFVNEEINYRRKKINKLREKSK